MVDITTVGVVGLGTMGAGIAEVFARAGLPVVATEVDEATLSAGRQRVETSLGRAVSRGRLDPAEQQQVLDRLRFTTDLGRLADADLVVEAVPERIEVKADLFARLDRICAARTILATNTSSLPVTRVAAGTARAGRVVGMHFFNPAPVMRLVEVVHTVLTEPDVVAAVRALAEHCGKTPVVVGDRAGFVANALLFGYLNQAARMAETGHAGAEDIDTAMTVGCGLPMGPLTLMDLIGLDVCLEVLEVMYDENRTVRFAPAPMLRRLVMAGHLGRKTGRGYYRYDDDRAPVAAVGVSSPEPVAKGTGGRVHLAGVPTAALADALPEATTDVADADVVVHVPRTPQPGSVAEVAALTRAGAGDLDAVAGRAAATGMVVVRCRHRVGFVAEALLFRHLDDAARMVDEGYASVDDVDTAMRLGCGYPYGPFAMLSAVGPEAVLDGLRAAGATPAPLLADLAAAPS